MSKYLCLLINSYLLTIGGQTFRITSLKFSPSLLYKPSTCCIFSVAEHLCRNRTQMTNSGLRTSLTCLMAYKWATFLFLPNFDAICDLFLNRHTAAWSLFVNFRAIFSLKNAIIIFLASSFRSTSPSVGLSNMHMNTTPMLMNHSQLHKLSLIKKADSYVNTIFPLNLQITKIQDKIYLA